MGAVRWLCLAAMIGCGRIGFGVIGAPGDASGDDGGNGDAVDALVTTSSVCPPTVAFSDDFNASTISAQWSTATGTNMTIAETGGYLELAFGAGTTPSGSTTSATQATAIDYTESCTVIEIDTIPDPTTMGQLVFRVGDIGAGVDFLESKGTLTASGKNTSIGTYPYDPVAHRFLRLRHHAGTWYWEISPDGVTFTSLGMATTFVPTPTTVQLQLIANGGTQNGGKVDYNSVVVTVP
jgi:hypothetical protein